MILFDPNTSFGASTTSMPLGLQEGQVWSSTNCFIFYIGMFIFMELDRYIANRN